MKISSLTSDPAVKRNYVLLGFLALCFIIYFIGEFKRVGDFKIFLDAGVMLNEKANIYLYNPVNGFKYWYSPMFAVLMAAFDGISPVVPILGWKILNLYFLFRIWKITDTHFIQTQGFTTKQNYYFQLFIAIGSFMFLSNTLHMAQMTIFLLYTTFEGLNLILYKRKLFWGALLIALAINIKIMPIVILPYLLFRKEFKAALIIVLLLLAFLVVPALFLGVEYNSFLHAEWFKSINPLKKEHVLDVKERGFHSLSALYTSLFTENKGNNFNLDMKRNILNLAPATVEMMLNLTRLALILLTLKVMKFKPFVASPSKEQTFYEISYISLITPLIFPHQQVYGFFLITPALIYCIYRGYQHYLSHQKLGIKNILLALAVIIYSLPLILGFMRYTLFHFKVITYGILLLMFLFLSYKPAEKQEKTNN